MDEPKNKETIAVPGSQKSVASVKIYVPAGQWAKAQYKKKVQKNGLKKDGLCFGMAKS